MVLVPNSELKGLLDMESVGVAHVPQTRDDRRESLVRGHRMQTRNVVWVAP